MASTPEESAKAPAACGDAACSLAWVLTLLKSGLRDIPLKKERKSARSSKERTYASSSVMPNKSIACEDALIVTHIGSFLMFGKHQSMLLDARIQTSGKTFQGLEMYSHVRQAIITVIQPAGELLLISPGGNGNTFTFCLAVRFQAKSSSSLVSSIDHHSWLSLACYATLFTLLMGLIWIHFLPRKFG